MLWVYNITETNNQPQMKGTTDKIWMNLIKKFYPLAPIHTNSPYGIRGSYMKAASIDEKIFKSIKEGWRVLTEEDYVRTRGHKRKLSFDKTGTLLSSVNSDELQIYDLKTLQLKTLFRGHESDIDSAMFDTTNSNHVFSCGEDCTIRQWDINANKCIHLINATPLLPGYKTLDSLSLSDNLIASSMRACGAFIWDKETRKLLHSFKYDGENLSATDEVEFLDSNRLVIGAGSRWHEIDLRSGKITPCPPSAALMSAQYGSYAVWHKPNEQLIVVEDLNSQTSSIWSFQQYEEKTTYGLKATKTHLLYSTWSDVKIFSIRTGKSIATLEGSYHSYISSRCIDMTSTGYQFAATFTNGSLRYIDLS